MESPDWSHDQLKKCWHRIVITTSEDSAKCKVMPKGNQCNAPGTRKKLWSTGCSSAYVVEWDRDIQVQSKLMALVTTQMSQKPHSAAVMTSWWLWCIKITLGWVGFVFTFGTCITKTSSKFTDKKKQKTNACTHVTKWIENWTQSFCY